jgi:small subunit ribosomal protein S19e
MIKAPEWAIFVKTGVHKERPPIQEDWWQIRAADVLRTIERMGPIGTQKLRTKYGGKKNISRTKSNKYKQACNRIYVRYKKGSDS